jgi:hypothetical protein
VGAPEEVALLVMSWLLDQGETARAEGMLEEIAPFFDRLRFFPLPVDRPLPSGEGVFVQSAAEVVAKLRARHPKQAVAALQEAIQIWTPLYDRAVMLLLETVEGEMPHLARQRRGSWSAVLTASRALTAAGRAARFRMDGRTEHVSYSGSTTSSAQRINSVASRRSARRTSRGCAVTPHAWPIIRRS